jgi:HEAT repeat protein
MNKANRSIFIGNIGIGLFLFSFCLSLSGCFPQPSKSSGEISTTKSEVFIAIPTNAKDNSEEFAIEELIGILDSVEVGARDKAIEELVIIGSPAVEPLINALRNGNYNTRKNVIIALGQIKDDRAVEPLMVALQDESSHVRREAAKALGLIKDTRAIDALILALHDENTSVKEQAAEALGEIGGARAVDALIEALTDEGSFVPGKAAIALGKIKDAHAVDPLLTAYRENKIYDRELKQALVMIGTPAVNQLISALNDEDTVLQGLAIEALGEIKDPRAVEPLIAYLKVADDIIPVKNALVMIGEPSVEPLIATLENEDNKVAGFSVQALGEIRDIRAVEPLIKVLLDENFYYRHWAAIALGEINDPRAIEPLIASMKGYNRAIQDEAKNALVKIGISSVDPLIVALSHEDPGIRQWAVVTLGEIKDPRAVDPLIKVLQDEDYYVRWQVPSALAEIGDDRVVDPLISSLHDKWSGIRMEVADALGQIKDPRSVDPLISALQDEDPYVRKQVALALGEIRDNNAIDPLITALNDKELEVRFAAAKALGDFKDSRAVNTLILALQHEDLEIIAGAYSFYINRGEIGSEALLVDALTKYGTSQMAVDFLNCGNPLLIEAATEWADSNGYYLYASTIIGNHPLWGSNQ